MIRVYKASNNFSHYVVGILRGKKVKMEDHVENRIYKPVGFWEN